MKILQIIGTLERTYGGPVFSCIALSQALNATGHESRIATLSRVSPGEWHPNVTTAKNGFGRYKFAPEVLLWLYKNLGNYDFAVVHGIWQFQSLATMLISRLKGVPYAVFAHGALDPWFRQEYPTKHIKKRLYWWAVEKRVLARASAILFTCEEERILSLRDFPTNRKNHVVIPYGIPDSIVDYPRDCSSFFFDAFPHLTGKRIVLFLSRLHKKKGLSDLIEAFRKICDLDSRLQLVIAGPDEDNLGADFRNSNRDQSLSHRITWAGMLTGSAKWGAYDAADVFALTSHSENFGLVVAEALSRNLPVLISNKVNIWREVMAAEAGFVEEDNPEGAAALLSSWLASSDAVRQDMRRRARLCYERSFNIEQTVLALSQLLSSSPSDIAGRSI